MIIKCPFCEYSKPDEPLNIDIIKILHEEDLPTEDYMLWIERLLKGHGIKSYNGVKIHIGRKHKELAYKYISPRYVLSKAEKEAINEVTA